MISIETPKQKPKKKKNRKLYQEEVHTGRTNSSTSKTTIEFQSIDLKTFTIMCKKPKQTAQIFKIARANRTSRMQKMTRTLEETAQIFKVGKYTRRHSKQDGTQKGNQTSSN
jgi:hypothetical protein